MRLNSKGQVTIPAELRQKYHLHEGDEVEVVDDDGSIRIVRPRDGETRGRRMVAAMRGKATTTMTTDELMDLLRGE